MILPDARLHFSLKQEAVSLGWGSLAQVGTIELVLSVGVRLVLKEFTNRLRVLPSIPGTARQYLPCRVLFVVKTCFLGTSDVNLILPGCKAS